MGYALENDLAHSAVVGKDYLLNVITMKDGSILNSMIRRETKEVITLAMPGGTTSDIKPSDIASRQEIAQLLMPPSLFDVLPLEQVADLVKYLSSPAQMPLPK